MFALLSFGSAHTHAILLIPSVKHVQDTRTISRPNDVAQRAPLSKHVQQPYHKCMTTAALTPKHTNIVATARKTLRLLESRSTASCMNTSRTVQHSSSTIVFVVIQFSFTSGRKLCTRTTRFSPARCMGDEADITDLKVRSVVDARAATKTARHQRWNGKNVAFYCQVFWPPALYSFSTFAFGSSCAIQARGAVFIPNIGLYGSRAAFPAILVIPHQQELEIILACMKNKWTS